MANYVDHKREVAAAQIVAVDEHGFTLLDNGVEFHIADVSSHDFDIGDWLIAYGDPVRRKIVPALEFANRYTAA